MNSIPAEPALSEPWDRECKADNKLNATQKVRQLADSPYPDGDEVKVPIRFGDIRALQRMIDRLAERDAFARALAQPQSINAVARQIADGFTNGNQQYDDATTDQRKRYDEAARSVLAGAPQPQVPEGYVLDEWTVEEVREAVRKSVDDPGCGHNVFARSHGITSAKLSEFLSGKRGAEPSIIEPCGFRWALVSSNDYPRREDTVDAMLAAAPVVGGR